MSNRNLIIPMSKASIASGADGLIIEVHEQPEAALCDGNQSLTLEMFNQLSKEICPYLEINNKKIRV